MSPAPSDIPVRKDDGEEETQINNIGSSTITNIEETQSEESSDDESDQDDPYNGYVALEQQLTEEEQQTTFGENDENANDHEAQRRNAANDTPPSGIPSGTSVDSSVPQATMSFAVQNFQMTDSQAEAIKEAMAGFNLPVNNIPDWANVVSEDNWKTKLMERIAKTRNDP
ncbi:uncharacterized protein LOC135691282 [Rhopilema esculentum]|uniref:uncharacterized protein LOC135691282 n=1 Tax=Rhopilema esculentum TaxID=499914 RepID=UPI0031E34975|eukprot:gene3036-1310_t